MKTPEDKSGGDKGGIRQDPSRNAFTMVEMIVTLLVACILMIAVVAFLVNGVVSTTKTTAINDSTVKGRYVFEHLSREMARANDLTISPTPAGGFWGANPGFVVPADPDAGQPGRWDTRASTT
jgi:prepilin-type N-terminal cleavage/methylation domain-containing protein